MVNQSIATYPCMLATAAVLAAGSMAPGAAVNTPYEWDFADNTFGGLTPGSNSAAIAIPNYTWSTANGRAEFIRSSYGTVVRRFGFASVQDSAQIPFSAGVFSTSVDITFASGTAWSDASWQLVAGATSPTLGFDSSSMFTAAAAATGGYRAVIRNVLNSGSYYYTLAIIKPGDTATSELNSAVLFGTTTSGFGTTGLNNPSGNVVTLTFSAVANGSTINYTATAVVSGVTSTTVTVTASEALSSVSTLGNYYGFSTDQGYSNNGYTTYFDRYSLNVAVPEPASAAALGLGGLAILRRRRARCI